MGDGWETARKPDRPAVYKKGNDGLMQIAGSDFSILKFGVPGYVEKVLVDTNHFRGNFPESCFIEACMITNKFIFHKLEHVC